MEKKYPVLKCTKELWEEIKPVLESFGITDFSNITYDFWKLKDSDITVYLVSNYGGIINSPVLIGNTRYRNNETINASPRYLVDTKEEFLSAVAKLLGKEYYNNNNMEKRNIQIDKETARKWYNGNDNTLKELALQAYKKEELKTISYYEILGSVNTTPNYHHIPYKQSNKWTAIHKLAIIAEYLNEGWKPDWTNINENKYFIYKGDEIKVSYVSRSRECMIYFKSKELAQKAIEIMGDEINYIFD